MVDPIGPRPVQPAHRERPVSGGKSQSGTRQSEAQKTPRHRGRGGGRKGSLIDDQA